MAAHEPRLGGGDHAELPLNPPPRQASSRSWRCLKTAHSRLEPHERMIFIMVVLVVWWCVCV